MPSNKHSARFPAGGVLPPPSPLLTTSVRCQMQRYHGQINREGVRPPVYTNLTATESDPPASPCPSPSHVECSRLDLIDALSFVCSIRVLLRGRQAAEQRELRAEGQLSDGDSSRGAGQPARARRLREPSKEPQRSFRYHVSFGERQ